MTATVQHNLTVFLALNHPHRADCGAHWIAADVAADVRHLMKVARAIKSRAERELNEPMTPEEKAKADRKEASDWKFVQGTATKYGAFAVQMQDVRGFSFTLHWKESENSLTSLGVMA